MDALGAAVATQLFGGLDLNATGIIDLTSGTVNFNAIISKLGNIINKAARERGSSGTSASRTLMPFYHDLLKPFLNNVLDRKMDLFVD